MIGTGVTFLVALQVLVVVAVFLLLAVAFLYLYRLERWQKGVPYPYRPEPCRTCRKEGSGAPRDFPVIAEHVAGSIRQCPRCGRFYDYDEVACGGGRLRMVDVEKLRTYMPELFEPGAIMESWKPGGSGVRQ